LILVSLVLTLVVRIPPREIGSILISPFILKTVLLIVCVLIFQKIMTISDAFEILKTWEVSAGMIVLFAFFISFAMGFLTGVNLAYIAIAYPILFPLIENLPNFVYLSLYIYVIGFAGILLSPLHLCLVLTNEYFNSNLYRVYRYMGLPVALMAAVATALVLLL
jgi:hypothetical protein